MLRFEDIDCKQLRTILEKHPQLQERWLNYVEEEEGMQEMGAKEYKPFQMILDENGNCIGITILFFYPKKLLVKARTVILDLAVWDETDYSKELMRTAITDRYPETEKILIHKGYRNITVF